MPDIACSAKERLAQFSCYDGNLSHNAAVAYLPVSVLVGASLLLSACGSMQRADDLYTTVPESVWPAMDGVTVVSSKGFKGNECCEAHVGSRDIVVRVVPHRQVLKTLQDSLTESGWAATDCRTKQPSKLLCARKPGYFAVLRAPHKQKKLDDGIVLVDVERSP